MNNIVININAEASKAIMSIASNATSILTNPVAATTIVATAAVAACYKHIENKDKRRLGFIK